MGYLNLLGTLGIISGVVFELFDTLGIYPQDLFPTWLTMWITFGGALLLLMDIIMGKEATNHDKNKTKATKKVNKQ